MSSARGIRVDGDPLLAQAATRAERLISFGRLLLVSAVVLRLLWLWRAEGMSPPSARGLTLLGWAGGAFGASLWVLVRYRRSVAPSAVMWISMFVDSGTCFVALASNSLWPGPRYAGNLALPDIAFLIVPIVGAGLRLSRPLALASGLLGFASLGALGWIDFTLFSMDERELAMRLSIVSVLLFTATACAVITAYYTRRLALDAAIRGARAARAETNLGELLSEQHDARSLLSSVALDAERLEAEIGERMDPARREDELYTPAHELREEIDALAALTASIRERAFAEIARSEGGECEAPLAVLRAAAVDMQRRFPGVQIDVEGCSSDAAVELAGGGRVLHTIARNLIANACEGDGEKRASRIWVETSAAERGVRIAVRDDGPGFATAVLGTDSPRRISTKREGSGLGLWIVERLLGERAHTLACVNPPEGGACVSFELPAAEATRAAVSR